MVPDIVFWQNIPSHHQAGAIEHFCKLWPECVYGVYDMEMLPERKAGGWKASEMQGVSKFFLDEQKDPARFVKEFLKKHTDAIHIFGGLRGGALSVQLASKYLLQRCWSKKDKSNANAKIGFIAEQPSVYGPWWRKQIRFACYRLFFHRHSKKLRFGLAMGTAGVDCYAKLGCPREILFPYIYQCNIEKKQSGPLTQASKEVKFIYVGAFSHRKGIDLLGSAVKRLPSNGWKLTLVGGGGNFEAQTLSWAEQTNQVSLFGSCPSGKVIQKIAEHDICIVPSRYDGWGMVTNESIQGGAGAIVSAAARSSDLIQASGAGKVVAAGSVKELAEAMKLVIMDRQILLQWKERARNYSSCIQKEAIGQYLFDVIQYTFIDPDAPRPTAGWLQRRIE